MISIIIPTYNEKDNISLLIQAILLTCRKSKLEVEILVIDDNSPDKTGEVVRKKYNMNPSVKVSIRKQERGLATAILHGIYLAKGEIIIGIDADFNHPPELIPILVAKLNESDFVIGSRFIKGGGMEEWGRYIGTYIFNYFLKMILGFPTMDNMSGFYAIRKETIGKLDLREIYRGYGEYHLRLVWAAKQCGMKIIEIPVYYQRRKYGESKSHLLKMFYSYLLSALKLRLKKAPQPIV